MKLTEITEQQAQDILTQRKLNMQSVEVQDMADIFYRHRNETLTSEDFENEFGCSRPTIHARIKYLKLHHGFDIVNTAKNGAGAKYKLVGFKEPQKKKAKQTKKKVKLSIPKPSTFNPLIAQVFA